MLSSVSSADTNIIHARLPPALSDGIGKRPLSAQEARISTDKLLVCAAGSGREGPLLL